MVTTVCSKVTRDFDTLGAHTLRWRYVRDSNGSGGDNAGWVDCVEWTPASSSSSGDWEEIEYTYDPSGRRIAKDVDGVVTKYVYDGDHCIAEYDGNDVLLRKYIYGPGIDQPICMIDVEDANAAYYYHYDALGSVVALSDADGDTVQVYEYDVFGQVTASDANHPNPFTFTGRRYDAETGLYYYRARYYNPSIGRFLQTDPIGYGDGMNMYTYCGNNPVGRVDPSGMSSGFSFSVYVDPGDETRWLQFNWVDDDGESQSRLFSSVGNWLDWASKGGATGKKDEEHNAIYLFTEDWRKGQVGYRMSGGRLGWFWYLQAMRFIDGRYESVISTLENWGVTMGPAVSIGGSGKIGYYEQAPKKVSFPYGWSDVVNDYATVMSTGYHPLMLLAHELGHAVTHWAVGDDAYAAAPKAMLEEIARHSENEFGYSLYQLDPVCYYWLYPVSGCLGSLGSTPEEAWTAWNDMGRWVPYE